MNSIEPSDTSSASPAVPDFARGVAGLLPAIAQDAEDGTVLMLAWMDRQAWDATLRSGRATYFSRSRNGLWRKGDTSGHVQHVVEIRVDCDADAILLRVQQSGAACHENYRSCFFRTVDSSNRVAINQARLSDDSAGEAAAREGNDVAGSPGLSPPAQIGENG